VKKEDKEKRKEDQQGYRALVGCPSRSSMLGEGGVISGWPTLGHVERGSGGGKGDVR